MSADRRERGHRGVPGRGNCTSRLLMSIKSKSFGVGRHFDASEGDDLPLTQEQYLNWTLPSSKCFIRHFYEWKSIQTKCRTQGIWFKLPTLCLLSYLDRQPAITIHWDNLIGNSIWSTMHHTIASAQQIIPKVLELY